jgi:tetratricopeptide (TPR) repeat protein
LREQVEAGERVMRMHMEATGATATAWSWLGTMRRTVYERTQAAGDARAAIEALERAAELSPNEVQFRVELARLEAALGNVAQAAAWATEAFRLNENLRLDPIRQLAGRDLEDMRRLAAGSK